MQQNCPVWYTRNSTVYFRIQYELQHVLYTSGKLRNTPFQWYPTQVFSINSIKDIAVLGLGLVSWEWFWKIHINFLDDFYYQFKHIPGTWNRADALSRCSNYDDGLEDNNHVVALSKQVFIWVLLTSVLDRQLCHKQKAHQLQLEVWRVKHKLTVKIKNDHMWYRGWALVVVGKEEDKRALLELYHDSSTARHPRQSKMLAALQ